MGDRRPRALIEPARPAEERPRRQGTIRSRRTSIPLPHREREPERAADPDADRRSLLSAAVLSLQVEHQTRRAKEALQEHKEIVAALVRRDAEDAEVKMRLHLRNARRYVEEQLLSAPADEPKGSLKNVRPKARVRSLQS